MPRIRCLNFVYVVRYIEDSQLLLKHTTTVSKSTHNVYCWRHTSGNLRETKQAEYFAVLS